MKEFILSHDTGQKDVTKLLTFTNGQQRGSYFNAVVLQNHTKFIDFFIQLGVYCTAEILSLACSEGNLAIVRYLIEDAGADPNQPDSRHKNASHDCVRANAHGDSALFGREVKVAVNKEVEGACPFLCSLSSCQCIPEEALC